jgi:hypothetical protein
VFNDNISKKQCSQFSITFYICLVSIKYVVCSNLPSILNFTRRPPKRTSFFTIVVENWMKQNQPTTKNPFNVVAFSWEFHFLVRFTINITYMYIEWYQIMYRWLRRAWTYNNLIDKNWYISHKRVNDVTELIVILVWGNGMHFWINVKIRMFWTGILDWHRLESLNNYSSSGLYRKRL